MEDTLPKEILYKRKQEFNLPLETWLRKDLKKEITEVILSGDTGKTRMFNRDYIEKILKEFFDGNDRCDYKIWELYVFELWYQKIFRGDAYE